MKPLFHPFLQTFNYMRHDWKLVTVTAIILLWQSFPFVLLYLEYPRYYRAIPITILNWESTVGSFIALIAMILIGYRSLYFSANTSSAIHPCVKQTTAILRLFVLCIGAVVILLGLFWLIGTIDANLLAVPKPSLQLFKLIYIACLFATYLLVIKPAVVLFARVLDGNPQPFKTYYVAIIKKPHWALWFLFLIFLYLNLVNYYLTPSLFEEWGPNGLERSKSFPDPLSLEYTTKAFAKRILQLIAFFFTMAIIVDLYSKTKSSLPN